MGTQNSQSATRVRITSKGRRALLALLAIPVASIGVFGVVHATGAEAGSEVVHVEFDTVTVQPGDTLWALAQRIAPNQDPRDVIVELELLHGIDSAVVPGQILSIPLAYSQS